MEFVENMFSEKSDYLKGESFFVGKILCTKTGALKGEPVFVANIFPFFWKAYLGALGDNWMQACVW